MRKNLVFFSCCLGILSFAIGSSAVVVAFPVIASELKTDLVMAGWVLTISQLVITVTGPVGGKLSDIYGRKKVFLISILFYAVGSLGCALSPNILFLIISRLVQGIGGGIMLPAVTGITVEEFPETRHRSVGLLSSFFSVGAIIGPNLGGWLIESFGWRSIFWINIPLGIIVLAVSYYFIRPGKGEGGKIDMVGAGLMTGMLTSLLLSISMFSGDDIEDNIIPAAVLVLTFIVLLFIFIRYERRIPNPVVDFQIFKEKPFLAANLFNLVLGFVVLGVVSFIPLYAVSVFGMSTLASGMILTPRSVAVVLTSVLASMLLFKYGYRKPMVIGSILTIISLAMFGIEPANNSLLGIPVNSLVLLIVVIFINGLGMGMILPAANNACIELMPKRVSTITGIRGMFRNFGGAIGVNVTTLILHYSKDIGSGLSIVFFLTVLLMILAIPAIFFMPSSCMIPTAAKNLNK